MNNVFKKLNKDLTKEIYSFIEIETGLLENDNWELKYFPIEHWGQGVWESLKKYPESITNLLKLNEGTSVRVEYKGSLTRSFVFIPIAQNYIIARQTDNFIGTKKIAILKSMKEFREKFDIIIEDKTDWGDN